MELMLSVFLLLGLPLGMLILFKSNLGIMFFAACSGLVLLSNLDTAVVSTAGAVVPGEGEAYIRLAVVLLSMVFAGLVFRDTTTGSAAFLSGVIGLTLAAMLALTLPAATGVSWLTTLSSENYWQTANDYKSLIIATGFLLSLLAVFTSQSKKSK